jgi:calcium permeable stress-gated cation channel
VFRSRELAAIAAQTMLQWDADYWNPSVAPKPGELYWENLLLRKWERSTRRILTYLGFLVVLVSFLAPVTFIQSFLDTEYWVKRGWPVLRHVREYPWLRSILQGILPGLAMVLLLLLLPPLLRQWERLGGARSSSEAEVRYRERYRERERERERERSVDRTVWVCGCGCGCGGRRRRKESGKYLPFTIYHY